MVESCTNEIESILQVACKVLGCEPEEVREEKYDSYGLKIFSAYGLEYAIGTDDGATEAVRAYIKDSAWTFRPEFIATHTKGGASNGMIKAIQALQEACESSNDDIISLIEDMEDFIEDAISSDGRGMFLSPYDSNEQEIVINGEYYYAYRLN
jgi:hypothetical protein